MVGHRGAAGLADFLDDAIGSRCVGTLALSTAAQIVDHHFRPVAREQQCMGAAETTTGAGHHDHLVFEANGFTHRISSSGFLIGCVARDRASVGQANPTHNQTDTNECPGIRLQDDVESTAGAPDEAIFAARCRRARAPVRPCARVD